MCMPTKRDAHLGVFGRLAKANHEVGLSVPACLESVPRESNLAIKGHPTGAQDNPRDGQTRAITTFG